jgi:hypothetical protein
VASKGVSKRSSRSRAARPFGDVALVFGKEEDGLHILRQRSHDGPVEAGIVKPLAEGRPISGEVISLSRRDDVPYLFDVKTELDASADGRGRRDAPEEQSAAQAAQAAQAAEEESDGHGPAQVATDAYRKGWDAIWGGRRGSSSRLN